MLTRLFADGFAKVTVFAVLVLFAVTSYLCVQNKAKQATIEIVEHRLAQQQLANQQLNQQLMKAQQQITDYLQQTKRLQENVLQQLQHKREQTDEILQILEKHKSWAEQPVPDDVSRVLKPAGLPSRKNHPATLPNGKSVPNATTNH